MFLSWSPGAVLAAFAAFGDALIRYLSISLASLMVAGGVLLFLVALDMMRGADSLVRVPEDASVALVPLGTPFLAGPGAIVASIVLTRQHPAFTQRLAVVAGAVVALLVVLASLRFASELARLLRPNAIHFLTRIMGLLLTRHRGAARRRRRSAVGPIGSGLSAIGAFDAPTRKCMNAADSGQVSATIRRPARREKGGLGMRKTHSRALTLLVVGAIALAAAPALAATVFFRFGPSSPFGGTRFDGELYAATRRVYFLGFRTFANATDGSVWYYDIASQTYVDTGVDMPVPISNYGIAALTDPNGLGFYVFGGRDANGNIVTTVQAYYPATNSTAVISSDPWPGKSPSGCVTLPASGVAAMGNKAFILGGASFSANGCLDENSAQTWIFDPMAPAGTRWTQGGNLAVARGYITPAVLAGKVYAIGGDLNIAGSLFAQQTVEASTNGSSWDDAGVADLFEPCDESQAFGFTSGQLANTIILAGCGQWPNAVPDVLQYDSAANTWSPAGTLNENRRNHAGAWLGTSGQSPMYILGGYSQASGFIDPTVTSELGPATTRPVSGGGSSAPHGSAGNVTTT
ncbi:MAG TPA: MarC family protein [Actinomycetota bacterium]|nr:MarC family protein [Actinomycetota bacterium]